MKIAYPLQLANTPIEQVQHFKFLGVHIDNQLIWDTHIKSVNSKLARAGGILNRIKNVLPLKIRKTLYNTLALPHISYGISVWGRNSKGLEKLQKRCIRNTGNCKFNAHTEPLCKALKILKVNDLYNLSLLRIAHKHLNKNLPSHLQQEEFEQSGETRTRGHLEFRLPNYRLSKCKNKINYKIPDFLNKIETDLRQSLTTATIKSCVRLFKQVCVENYDPLCNIRNCYICGKSNQDLAQVITNPMVNRTS